MDERRIKFSALWISLMFTYLLGDVLRIFSGDFETATMGGIEVTSAAYLGMAVLFTIPIAMIFFSLILRYPVNRWANLVAPALFFVINLIGLPTYPSLYDKFLNLVGLGFNLLTIWYAWNWRPGEG